MRRIIYAFVLICFLLLLVLGGLFLFGTADIRTELSKNRPDAAKGKALLQKMSISHGLKSYQNWETVRVKWSDEFAYLPSLVASPFPEQKYEGSLAFTPGSWDSRLDFSTGALSNVSWGIQSGQTYQRNSPDSELVFEQNKEIEFWLPTYQYFVELPNRISEADVILYAGTKEVDGKVCDGVYASWRSAEVQRDIDQYNLWINRETGLIELVEFTIRDYTNFAVGSVRYLEYKNFDGLKLATYMPVKSPPLPGYLHEMRISGFEADGISLRELQPKKELIGKGFK